MISIIKVFRCSNFKWFLNYQNKIIALRGFCPFSSTTYGLLILCRNLFKIVKNGFVREYSNTLTKWLHIAYRNSNILPEFCNWIEKITNNQPGFPTCSSNIPYQNWQSHINPFANIAPPTCVAFSLLGYIYRKCRKKQQHSNIICQF